MRVFWNLIAVCVFYSGFMASAQVLSLTRGISTDPFSFFNTSLTFNETKSNTNSNTEAVETASQNSTITTNSDGTIVINGDGSAYATADDSNPDVYSILNLTFTNQSQVNFTFNCSVTGGSLGSHAYFSVDNPSIYVPLTGNGSTNISGVMNPGTCTINIQCTATPGNLSGTWTLQFNTTSSSSQGTYKADTDDCHCDVAGEPIRISTGDMFEGVTDYSTAGENPLAFARYYHSLADPNSAAMTLGKNWRSTYDRYLRISSSVVVERADGQELVFSLLNGTWASDSDVNVQLLQSGSIWTLIDSDDTIETYSSAGLLTTIQAVDGYKQTMAYNGNNQLTNVTDSLGRALSLTYQNNLLHTVTAPNGLVLTYGYNASSGTTTNRLTSVTYSTTPQTSQSYLYESNSLPFALTGILDENGNRYASWTYDSKNRATSSRLGTGADLTSIYYNDSDGSRIVTNALGQALHYIFTNLQNVPKLTEIDRLATATTPAAVMKQTYDSKGYLASISDWNTNLTSLVNDPRGLPVFKTEASGTSQTRAFTNIWYQTLHLPGLVYGPRMSSFLNYDTNTGNLLSRTDTDNSTNTVPYSTAGQTRIWTNTYGSFGHLLTATGPRTDVIATTSYTYDTNGNVSTVTDPLGHKTTLTNYNGSGLPATIIDPNGVTTRLTYDARDRLLTRAVLAASGNATNTFGYDAVGQLTSLTLPDGERLTYQYDAAHRLQSVSNSIGESISYLLDANDDITNQTIHSASGAIVKTQSRVFDALGRLIQDIGANSQTNTYQYDSDGNRVSLTDGLNHNTMRAFDALNRLIGMIDPLNNITAYGYDPQDNLISVTDPRSLTTSYVYDGFRRVIQENSPDTGTTVYRLDKAGNRTNEVDARGIVRQRVFDKLNRVTSETFPASTGENITFNYDSTASGNFGIGRLTGYSDETGSNTLTYNERGDVIKSVRTIGTTVYTTTNGYDLADHLTSIKYPSGDFVSIGRDTQGRIYSVSFRANGSGTPVVLANYVAYLPFGPMTSFSYGNALIRSQYYDQDYRLTNIITSGSVQNLGIGYDTANDIKSITDNLTNSRSQTFGYDADYRLTSANGLYGGVQYTYDGDGNRLTKTAKAVTETNNYVPFANQLQSVTKPGNSRHFQYTAAGNMSSDDRGTSTTLHFNYSNRNRYNALTNGTTVASYKYNALGERLIKTVNGVTTHFHYDERRHLIAESQGSNGALIREYVWLDDMPLAQIEADGSIYYIHPDQLNTSQKMTDVNGIMVWDREQQPFGEDASLNYPKVTPVVSSTFNRSTKQFKVTVSGTTNYTFTLQSSTNLVGSLWTSLMSGTVPFTFTDSQVANTRARFYRAYGTYSTITNNLRFPGQYFDAESGLNYNMMRDYDPTLGRYVQSDLIGKNRQFSAPDNLYAYSKNSPALFYDSSGFSALSMLIEHMIGQYLNTGLGTEENPNATIVVNGVASVYAEVAAAQSTEEFIGAVSLAPKVAVKGIVQGMLIDTAERALQSLMIATSGLKPDSEWHNSGRVCARGPFESFDPLEGTDNSDSPFLENGTSEDNDQSYQTEQAAVDQFNQSILLRVPHEDTGQSSGYP
jgi:RHS repeat-associated protein